LALARTGGRGSRLLGWTVLRSVPFVRFPVMLDSVLQLVERIGPWGYLIIFLIVVLECQPVLGLFMPGESLVLVGGFLASRAALDLGALIAVVAVAAILGDSLGFELGRRLGRDWLLRHGRRVGIREPQLAHLENFFARHGGKAALAAHFMHVLRSLGSFTAGASRMPYRVFLFFNTLGCVLWAATFGVLGYLLGESWLVAEKWLGRGGLLALLALTGALGFVWLLRRNSGKERSRQREEETISSR